MPASGRSSLSPAVYRRCRGAAAAARLAVTVAPLPSPDPGRRHHEPAALLAVSAKHDASRAQEPAELLDIAVTVLSIFLPTVVLPALAPRLYARHQALLGAAARAAYFSLPNSSNPRGIPHVLQASTHAGGRVGVGGGGDVFSVIECGATTADSPPARPNPRPPAEPASAGAGGPAARLGPAVPRRPRHPAAAHGL